MDIIKNISKVLNLNLKPYDLKKLSKKKTYLCAKDEYDFLFIYIGKSRFLMKDALFLENLVQQINMIKNKYFFTTSPLCSKAKNHLEMKGFKIYVAL